MRQARHKNLTAQFTKVEAKMTSMFCFRLGLAWQWHGNWRAPLPLPFMAAPFALIFHGDSTMMRQADRLQGAGL